MQLLITFLLAFAAFGQTPQYVEVCFKTQTGTQTCRTLEPHSTTIITVDLRNKPVPAVVFQKLPSYQMKAMQDFVDAQTFRRTLPDGSLQTLNRYQNVQDLILQNLIRSVMVPALNLYPPAGLDSGKQSYNVVMQDLMSNLVFYPAW